MSHLKIVFGLICSINLVTSFFHNYGGLFEVGSNKLEEKLEHSFVHKKWIEMPLDHFNEADNRTFKIKYYERTSFFKESKPIFLINPSWTLTEGLMVDLAKETNGALFAFSPRYYFDSLPFDRFTTENMKFLNTRQTLADFAYFLKFIKSSPKFRKSKVVVAGGNSAVWMRLIYPDLVDAAYASFAPVLAKLDFFEWAEKISDNFEQYGSPGCWDRIAKISAHYVKLFQTAEGIEELRKELQICPECDMIDRLDQQNLYIHYWLQRFEGVSLWASNTSAFKDFCDRNFSLPWSKENYLGPQWNILNGHYCWCSNFKWDVEFYKTYNFPDYYQLCTEFSYSRTTSSDNQPFTKFITMDYFTNICEYLFGPDFNVTLMAKGVEETNALYGGLKPNVTKVVFVSGEFDPSSRLSVLEDLSPDAPAMTIAPYHADWQPEQDGDSEQVKKVRARVKALLKSWIGEGEYNMKP